MKTPLSIYVEWALAMATAAVYAFFVLRVVLFRMRKKNKNIPVDFVPASRITVIIPARNEEKQVAACIRSVTAQKYPAGLLQILVVDDHSDDRTVALAQAEAANAARHPVSVLSLAGSGGKKAAITRGVEAASGEIIVTTDADCLHDSGWLRSIAFAFETGKADLVIGPVVLQEERTFFDYIQGLELCGLSLVTSAGALAGRPMLASGANLAYRKTVFEQAGGFSGDTEASGDDMLLLQRVLRTQAITIGFPPGMAGVVHTKAQSGLRSFFRQRIRWTAKFRKMRDPWLRLTALAALGANLMVVAGPLLACVFSGFVKPYLLLIGVKAGIDFLLLSLAASYFQKPRLLHFFLPAFVFNSLYVVVTGAGSVMGTYSWKGRRWPVKGTGQP